MDSARVPLTAHLEKAKEEKKSVEYILFYKNTNIFTRATKSL